jgi:hypothetical protein
MTFGQYTDGCQHPAGCYLQCRFAAAIVGHSCLCPVGAHCVQVVFRDPVRYKLQKVLTVAAEGTYSGQVCLQTGCGFQQQGGWAGSSSSRWMQPPHKQLQQLGSVVPGKQCIAAAKLPWRQAADCGVGMQQAAIRCKQQHPSRGALRSGGGRTFRSSS